MMKSFGADEMQIPLSSGVITQKPNPGFEARRFFGENTTLWYQKSEPPLSTILIVKKCEQ